MTQTSHTETATSLPRARPTTSPTGPAAVPTAVLAACALTLAAAVLRLALPAPSGPWQQLLPAWVAVPGPLVAGAAVLAGRHAPAWTSRLTWLACGLLAVTAADGIAFDVVGGIMHGISAVTGDPLPVALALDVPGITVRLLAGATALLVGRRALGMQRAARGACTACGTGVRGWSWTGAVWPGYAACVLALGYATEKIHWGLGGTVGLASPDAFGDDVHLWTPGLGDTAVLALIGAGIALALVRPWGRRIPRWALLSAAALGSAMLVPVGVMGTVVTLRDLGELLSGGASIGLQPWVFVIEYPWFLAWGLTLGSAAVCYHLRTRHRCRACDGA